VPDPREGRARLSHAPELLQKSWSGALDGSLGAPVSHGQEMSPATSQRTNIRTVLGVTWQVEPYWVSFLAHPHTVAYNLALP